MDEQQKLLKKQYFDINLTKEQQSEDYYLNMSSYEQKIQEEAEAYAAIQTEQEQKLREAEKLAGLNQKQVPAQEVPEEAMKQMEAEYASIHKGKKLSGKARSKVKKEYHRKERQAASTKKIFEAQNAASGKMADFMIAQTLKVTGKEKLVGNTRKNSHAVALSTMLNGQSMANAAYAMRSLSVNWRKANAKECERKAMETERIFQVIMDYDLSKLKYSNSDEFLKNLGEKLTITQLAMECDDLMTDYRAMREAGKIPQPLADKFLNEIDARIKTLTTIATRVTQKATIMKSPLYSLQSEDSIKDLSEEELTQRVMKYGRVLYAPDASEEEKKQAKEYSDYYQAILTLRNLDKSEKELNRFGRNTDPNRLLELNRKEVNTAHPPVEDPNESQEEAYQKATLQKQFGFVVDGHVQREKTFQSKLTFQGDETAIDYAKLVRADNMSFLKENAALRRREIGRYYANMHRGKKIPSELLGKIEQKFQERFQEAENLSAATAVVDEFNQTQARRVSDFLNAHKDKEGKLNISADRGANSYLLLLDGKTMEEKEKSYKAYIDLLGISGNVDFQKYQNLPEKQKEEEKKRIAEGTKPLMDYVNGFDVKKLEFTKPSELISRYKEVGVFLNLVEEMQHFPLAVKRLGIMDEESWIEFQARVVMAQDLSAIIKNMMAMQSSGVYSLVDDGELSKMQEAADVDMDDKEAIEESGIPKELLLDAKQFTENGTDSDGLPELNQIVKYYRFLNGQNNVSYYHPGGSMEDAMKKYRADAKKEWDKS